MNVGERKPAACDLKVGDLKLPNVLSSSLSELSCVSIRMSDLFLKFPQD